MDVTLIDGTKADSYSEAWRHECEARTVLAMPLAQRRDFLKGYKDAHTNRTFKGVAGNRGQDAVARLQDTMQAIWLSRQVDKLLAMDSDDQRMAHLLKIEEASSAHRRTQVEEALKGRLAANDNYEG